jgi:hypothetical protein
MVCDFKFTTHETIHDSPKEKRERMFALKSLAASLQKLLGEVIADEEDDGLSAEHH